MGDDHRPKQPRQRQHLVSKDALRAVLVRAAQDGKTLSYSQVAVALGHTWTRGFMSSLARAIRELGEENTERNEPLLMTLVVNSETHLPGGRYFSLINLEDADMQHKRQAFERERDRITSFNWNGRT
jgi:hypothetical protein